MDDTREFELRAGSDRSRTVGMRAAKDAARQVIEQGRADEVEIVNVERDVLVFTCFRDDNGDIAFR